MSVPSEINLVSYIGNGSQKLFPYTFRTFAADDLQVVLEDSDGAETTLTLNTHYTVSGVGSYTGGNVTLTTAPTSTQRITIRRKIPVFVQNTDLRNQGAFFAETHEDAFDLLTMMMQQLKTDLARSAKITISSAAAGVQVEFPKSKPMKIIGWNEDGTELVNHDFGTLYDGKIVQGGFYDQNGEASPEEQAAIINAGTY